MSLKQKQIHDCEFNEFLFTLTSRPLKSSLVYKHTYTILNSRPLKKEESNKYNIKVLESYIFSLNYLICYFIK